MWEGLQDICGADSLAPVPLKGAASLEVGPKLAKPWHWTGTRAMSLRHLFQVWGGNKSSLEVLVLKTTYPLNPKGPDLTVL